jgi:LysM repeat protein
MRRRSPARWLAPLALLACAFAIYTVVDHELLNKDDRTTQTTSSTRTGGGRTTSARKTTRKRTTRRTYTVRAGDSLSSIASKEGVDVAALVAANPRIDPGALHPGQRLKLPR